jgi:hypothetical protein
MALTHNILNRVRRPWGYEVSIDVLDGASILESFNPYFPHPPSDEEITAIMASIKTRLQERIDYEAVRSDIFDDLGLEIKEAVWWLIKKIRDNPNATYAQAETVWNNEWADSLFTWAKITAYVQKKAGNVTWNQFKTYVINHKFVGVD